MIAAASECTGPMLATTLGAAESAVDDAARADSNDRASARSAHRRGRTRLPDGLNASSTRTPAARKDITLLQTCSPDTANSYQFPSRRAALRPMPSAARARASRLAPRWPTTISVMPPIGLSGKGCATLRSAGSDRQPVPADPPRPTQLIAVSAIPRRSHSCI